MGTFAPSGVADLSRAGSLAAEVGEYLSAGNPAMYSKRSNFTSTKHYPGLMTQIDLIDAGEEA